MNDQAHQAMLARLLAVIHEGDGKSQTVDIEASVNKAIDQIHEYRKVSRLAEAVARSRGRFHSQNTICDLMDHYGLPSIRPKRQ